MEQQELARNLYEEISRDFKCNNRTRRTDLKEFMILKIGTGAKDPWVEFSVGWFDVYTITFRPKTVGVKLCRTNKETKETKTLSKSYPLDQPNLLDTCLALLDEKIK